MDPEVTLIAMGPGLPERTRTAMNDDKHTVLDPWQPKRMTWDQVLQVSEVSRYQNTLFLRLIVRTDTSTGADYV